MGLILGLAAAVTLTDALTKAAAANELAGAWRVVVLDHLLELRLTKNDGMALGILSGNEIAIIVLPVVVIVCGLLLMRKYRMTTFTRVAAGLVLGGFLGNFVERAAHGYVLDMIYFPFLPWFVCNLADIAICAGVVLLGVSLIFRPQDWSEKHAKDKPDRAG